MFCPKCGTQNLETGRFCRHCGADLGNVPDALAGNLQKRQTRQLSGRRGKPVSWDSAFGKLFTGLAFLIVAIILGLTGAAGGRDWWFWMLIPAFGALGSGVAQIIQMKSGQGNSAVFASDSQNAFPSAAPRPNLPPPQTDLTEVMNLARTGNEIEAIKVYREIYGVGLKEAKDAVDKLEMQPVGSQNNFDQPPRGSIFDTGDLTPPSVTENTTKHLQIDKEGETMTLPKSNL